MDCALITISVHYEGYTGKPRRVSLLITVDGSEPSSYTSYELVDNGAWVALREHLSEALEGVGLLPLA